MSGLARFSRIPATCSRTYGQANLISLEREIRVFQNLAASVMDFRPNRIISTKHHRP